MTAPHALYAGLDTDALDGQAVRLIMALMGLIEFGRGEATDGKLFEAAVAKALFYAQAALITHPDAAAEPDALLDAYADELRKTVATFREVG